MRGHLKAIACGFVFKYKCVEPVTYLKNVLSRRGKQKYYIGIKLKITFYH